MRLLLTTQSAISHLPEHVDFVRWILIGDCALVPHKLPKTFNIVNREIYRDSSELPSWHYSYSNFSERLDFKLDQRAAPGL
jgi:hypothetical protein